MPRLPGPRAGTSKRKADGPVPVSAATKPPPAKRARKTFVSAISGDEESAVTHGTSDESGAGARRVRERREKRGRPEEDNDEDDQDGGMTDTQQLLAIVKFGSKEKRETAREAGAYARAVEKRMEKRRGGVKAIIEERERDGAKYNAQFLASFKAAYTLAAPFASLATLRQRRKTLTASGRGLLEAFEHAAGRVSSLDTSLLESKSNAWIEEDKALAKILAAGKRIAAHKHQRILNAEGKKGTKTRLNADEVRAERLLYDADGQGQKGSSVWGEIARTSEKAVRKLARAVERD